MREREKRKNNIYHLSKGLLESIWRLLMTFNGNLRGQKYRVIFLPIRKGFKIFEGGLYGSLKMRRPGHNASLYISNPG